MSKIALPALYQTDTSGSSYRHNRFQKPQDVAPKDGWHEVDPSSSVARGVAPARSPDFLVQLMVDGDQHLRKVIGRRDIAESRETAYGKACANRPSRKPDLALLLELKA